MTKLTASCSNKKETSFLRLKARSQTKISTKTAQRRMWLTVAKVLKITLMQLMQMGRSVEDASWQEVVS